MAGTGKVIALIQALSASGASPEEIKAAVSEWLAEHVDPETGYVLDDTLSIAGAAADAKAAGDEINGLKSANSEMYEEVIGDYTASATYTGRSVYYVDSTHSYLKEQSGSTVKEFALKAGVTYTVRGSGQKNVAGRYDLYVTTATKFPTPTGQWGTAVAPIDYYRLTSDNETVEYTPSVDCYIYVSQIDTRENIVLRGPLKKLKADVVASQTLPLMGKKIVNFGDSIYGNYRDTFGKSMSISSMIAERTGATVYNAGLGGTRMAAHTVSYWDAMCMYRLADAIATGSWTLQESALEDGASDFPAYFSDTITMLEGINWNNIDIITMGYGTNDFMGANSESTFKNALDYVIETILTAYPHLRIYVISPTFRWWAADDGSDTHKNSNNNTIYDYVGWGKTESDKYHVGYIDVYTNLGINLINRLAYFYEDDGTHPNVTGRRLIAYKIVGTMQTE